MRHSYLPHLIVCALGALSVAGCDEDGAFDNSVGQYGGDCVDGDAECVDEFGAELCPMRPTGYDGDDLALCEPESVEEGLFLHYGPKKYDEESIKPYLIEPFGEIEDCVYVRTPNDEPVYVNAFHGRMRPYSHHLIVTMAPELPEGVELGELTECTQGELFGSRWLLGSQDPQIDLAVEGGSFNDIPVEEGDPEFGAGQLIPPHSLLRLNMHYVNGTDQELLREAWITLQTTPKEDVEQYVDMITFFQGAIDIPPNSKGTKTAIGSCTVPSERYVHMITGHFHENGTRFTVWHEPKGEDPYKVYETFDWDVPGNAFYSDRIENPEIKRSNIWGATTGYLHVKPGDRINFQCEFDNPTNSRVSLGELGADQMCNVFGMYYPTNGDVWNCVCAGELCI